jgi:hypothetical protein
MFPITMSFTVSTPADLARLVAAATGVVTSPASEGKATAAPKPEPAKTEATAATPSTAQAGDAPEQKVGTSAPAAASGDLAAVEARLRERFTPDKALAIHRGMTTKMVAAKGREATVALLTKYGAKLATDLKPEQVVPYLLDVEQALTA